MDVLPPPTAEGMAALWDRISELESRTDSIGQPVANAFPTQPVQHIQPSIARSVPAPKSEIAGIFLDWDSFTWLGGSVPKPKIDIPEVRLLTSDRNGTSFVLSVNRKF